MAAKPALADVPVKSAALGRPKDLSKGAAILDAAKRLFTTQGFAGVSMDQIAAEAGVSKLTVYSHFGDKDTLFVAAVKAYCEQRLPDSVFEMRPDVALRERLLQIARAYFAMVSSPETIAGHRVLCAPQMSDSNLPRQFWQAGPMRVQACFAELLRGRMAMGELAINDVPRAASQFFSLVKGEPHAKLILGCDEPGKREIERHLDATVELFLRAYAPS